MLYILQETARLSVCARFMLYILQETARLSVCARQVRGSILQNFGRLVAYLCRVVWLRQ